MGKQITSNQFLQNLPSLNKGVDHDVCDGELLTNCKRQIQSIIQPIKGVLNTIG